MTSCRCMWPRLRFLTWVAYPAFQTIADYWRSCRDMKALAKLTDVAVRRCRQQKSWTGSATSLVSGSGVRVTRVRVRVRGPRSKPNNDWTMR